MAEYHLDENVAVQIARLLSSSGRPTITYLDLGLRGAPDFEHLLIATRHGRVLLTNNWEDFELLHGAWRRWSADWGVPRPHGGILVLDQRASAEEAVAAIIALEASGWPLASELYRWKRRSGWERHTER